MKEAIKELGSLCKMASELERKWDETGKNYLDARVTSLEYHETVRAYLEAVRRLESSLALHLAVVAKQMG